MHQQKITRGLAASAVAALAITGLTAAPAHAAPDVDLLSIFNAGGHASTRPTYGEGVPDQTLTLTASVNDTDLENAYFQYNADETAGPSTGGWTTISGTTVSQGFMTVNWTPDPALNGTQVAVRAVANDTGEPDQYAIRNNVSISAGDPVHAVRLVTTQGYFDQPYADSGRTSTYLSVRGSTSATSGTVALSAWRSSAGAFQGQTNAVVREETYKIGPGVYVPYGQFQGAIDISAYDADPGEVIAVAAERDSDDVQPATLYAQLVTTVDATFQPNTPTTLTSPMTVTVTDQNSRPVAGAEVRRFSDGSLVGYTGADGTVTGAQASGSVAQYYVNTTDTDAFEGGGTDVVSGVESAPPHVPEPWTTEARFADGTAFDDDEYAAGDITLQVRDQLGEPFGAGAEVLYRLHPTGSAAPAPTTATTDADGRITVPFDKTGPDGSWSLSFTKPTGSPGADPVPVTFVAGDATLSLTPTAGAAASGGQIVYTGSLAVGSTPLPGRAVGLAYTRGPESAPGGSADAGLVGTGNPLVGSTTTAADGTFWVTVADAAEATSSSETGQLSAGVTSAAESASATASFTPAPVTPTRLKVRLSGVNNGRKADVLRIDAPGTAVGERLQLFRKNSKGTWDRVLTRKLGRGGDATVTVRDRNGGKVTEYRVVVPASAAVQKSTSNTRRVR